MTGAHMATRRKSRVTGANGALPEATSRILPPSLAVTFLHTSQSVNGEACEGMSCQPCMQLSMLLAGACCLTELL